MESQIKHLLRHANAKVLIVTKDARQARIIFDVWRSDAQSGDVFWNGYSFLMVGPIITGPSNRRVQFWNGDAAAARLELGGIICTNVLYTVYDYETMLCIGSKVRSPDTFGGCLSLELLAWESM